jgi:hypothetical protein
MMVAILAGAFNPRAMQPSADGNWHLTLVVCPHDHLLFYDACRRKERFVATSIISSDYAKTDGKLPQLLLAVCPNATIRVIYYIKFSLLVCGSE